MAINTLYSTLPDGIKADYMIKGILSMLLSAYEDSNDKNYLFYALTHIQIYLQSGHLYEENADLFNKVILPLDISPDEIIKKAITAKKTVKITKNSLNTILGRWPAYKNNTHTKNSAIQEILHNVKSKHIGCFTYCAVDKENLLYKKFTLEVTEKESSLYDHRKNMAYVLR